MPAAIVQVPFGSVAVTVVKSELMEQPEPEADTLKTPSFEPIEIETVRVPLSP